MIRGAAISGLIRDQQGLPAEGVRVAAFQELIDGSFSTAAAEGRTDDRGEYRIFGLAPGTYVLASSAPTMLPRAIGIRSSQEIDSALSALKRRAAAGPGGFDRNDVPGPQAVTSGINYFPGVVTVTEAARLMLSSGDDRAGTDISLRWVQPAAVEGTILSLGVPVSRIALTMAPSDPQPPIAANHPGLRLESGADGRFAFSNVAPGRYTIRAVAAGAAPAADQTGSEWKWWGTADIQVDGRDMTGVVISLRRALRFKGRLLTDSVGPVPDLSKWDIVLRTNTWAGTVLTTKVRTDGTFDLDGILPGQYEVSLSGAPADWWLGKALVGNVDVLDAPLVIPDDTTELPEAAFTCSDRHSALAGRLHVPPTHAASSYFVVVYPVDRTLWRFGSRRIRVSRPNTDGTFMVRDLPAGAYLVAAVSDYAPSDLGDPAFLATLVPAASTVTIVEGTATVQDFRIGG
jgi:hypothetical protein